jgi:O-glycosyl hydrolase
MHAQARVIAAALVAAFVLACSSSGDNNPTSVTASRFATMSASATPTATANVTLWAQELKGWGVYPGAGSLAFYKRPQIEQVIYDLGATFIREQIDPALYKGGSTLSNMWIDQSLLNGYISKIQTAKAHGVRGYILSVWSPPAAWKTNGSILGVVNGNVGYLKSWDEAAYVAYLTKVLLLLKSSPIGLPIALSIQNEPAHTAPYGGTRYEPAQWQRVIKSVRGSFDYNGLGSVVLFGPETGQYTPAIYSNYITNTPGYLGGVGYPALNNAALNHAVGAYAFHTYAECSLTNTINAMHAHPKDAWMTEYGNPIGSNDLAWTFDMLSAMAAHLVIIPHNYWAWWMGFNPSSSAPGFGVLVSGQTSPIYSKRYWALKKLWNMVRPGWHVQHMWSSDPDLPAEAGSQDPCTARVRIMTFKSGDGKAAVVMVVNTTANIKSVKVGGLPGSSVHTFRTDAWRDMEAYQNTNVYKGYSTLSIPPRTAVLAFVN